MVTSKAQSKAALRAAVEHYFSETYLFEPENHFFRERVSPRDTKGLEAPPSITCTSLLQFGEIHSAVGGDAADAVQALVSALQSSTVVEVAEETVAKPEASGDSDASASQWVVRRRTFLNPAHDPALRTVVARPLPVGATLEELQGFFARDGTSNVESFKVLRQARDHGNQQWCAYSIRMNSVKAAEAIVRRYHSTKEEERNDYGQTETALARRFFPARLYVSLLPQYEEQQNVKRKQREDQQLQRSILKAQTVLSNLQNAGSAGAGATATGTSPSEGHAAPAHVTRYLAKGVTLRADDVPANVTWQTLKTTLGNISDKHPTLKRAIQLVQVEDVHSGGGGGGRRGASGAATARRAFVVCRSAQAARDLLTATRLLDGPGVEELHRVCARLDALTEEEEVYARQQYPVWCAPKVGTKITSNRKRQRY